MMVGLGKAKMQQREVGQLPILASARQDSCRILEICHHPKAACDMSKESIGNINNCNSGTRYAMLSC